MSSRLSNLFLITAILFAVIPAALTAVDKIPINFHTPGANSVYTRQQSFEVGDIPGHQVRIFELKRSYPEAPPRIKGVSIKEIHRHGFSDYTEGTGPAWGYDKFIMENGDVIYLEWNGTSVVKDNEGLNSHFVGVLTITGGTGIFTGIKGILTEELDFSAEQGYNESRIQGQYWLK